MEKTVRLKINWVPILSWLYLFFAYTVGMMTAEGSRVGGYLLIGILLLIFAAVVIQYRNCLRIEITYFHIYILLFGFYCALSALWAQNTGVCITRGIDITEILVAMTIMYFYYQNEEGVDSLLKVVMYGCYSVVIYALLYYDVDEVVAMLTSVSRVSNDAINANSLGMCAAYAIIINLYYILYDRIRIRDVLLLISVPMLIVSGSRKALFMVVAGVFGIFVLRNWDRKKFAKSVVKVCAVVIILLILFLFLAQLPAFAGIVGRMKELINILFEGDYQRGNSAWIRLEYNKLGRELFSEHPILGIGIGNANIYTQMYYGHDHFLHNNYIELLACGGLVGFILYYSIYGVILFRMIRFRKCRDKEYDICLIILALVLVLDYGMVSYFDKTTYIFLLLLWMESEHLKRKALRKQNGYT